MADEEKVQDDPTPEPGSGAEAGIQADADWKGFRLDEMGGVQVGRIEGRVKGKLEWIVARMGRFGHYCLVPGRDAVTANDRVWVPFTRDQIRRAPRIEPNAPLEAEQKVLAHYGFE
jgi:hypothetical protein